MSNERDHNSNPRHRTISEKLAPIIEQLELKGDPVILLQELKKLRPSVPETTMRSTVHDLVQRGWLKPLAVRGAYEFIPASAAGMYSSGDPWLNLKAALRLRPELKMHVGFSSAAWIHGYLERSPSRYTIVAARVPKPTPSLTRIYTVIQTNREKVFGAQLKLGIPVATIERVFAEIAWRPDLLDIKSDIEWVRKIGAVLEAEVVADYLSKLAVKSAWARAGYLAESMNRAELAKLIEERMPDSKGPFYWGDDLRNGRFVSRWKLYDNVGLGDLGPDESAHDF